MEEDGGPLDEFTVKGVKDTTKFRIGDFFAVFNCESVCCFMCDVKADNPWLLTDIDFLLHTIHSTFVLSVGCLANQSLNLVSRSQSWLNLDFTFVAFDCLGI